jgi:D-3-phosphoglycerate dehydrogenase
MRVLIIDDVHPILEDGLNELGFEVDYKPTISIDELVSCINQYSGLVVRTKLNIDQHVLSHSSKLQFIARAGAGLDNIDTTYCDTNNIHYFNAGEANADAVGEHTLAMMLSLATKLQKADKEVRAKIWDRIGNTGWELKGKTIGIIGFGNTGKAVAKKLSGFDVKVIVYDKYLLDYGNEYATAVNLETIQQQADILTFHVPLTQETENWVNSTWINQCKKQIVLLNLSRGKIINLEDVISALDTNKILAAGFDVLENEKLKTLNEGEKKRFEQLIEMKNVVLSPHVGGWTEQSYLKIAEVLLQKIKQLTLC